MRAKRGAQEVQVLDMPEPMVVPDERGDDLAETLDRELSRLPEKHRIPIVLCDLEGRTHQEAASQLGWPIGTVSSRLSRARSILARRLDRRGMSLSVSSLAVLLAQESASAVVPTRLIVSTARSASLFAVEGVMAAGVAPAGVAALTKEMLKAMFLGKLKIADSDRSRALCSRGDRRLPRLPGTDDRIESEGRCADFGPSQESASGPPYTHVRGPPGRHGDDDQGEGIAGR